MAFQLNIVVVFILLYLKYTLEYASSIKDRRCFNYFFFCKSLIHSILTINICIYYSQYISLRHSKDRLPWCLSCGGRSWCDTPERPSFSTPSIYQLIDFISFICALNVMGVWCNFFLISNKSYSIKQYFICNAFQRSCVVDVII